MNLSEQSVVLYDPSPVWLNAVEGALSAAGMDVAGRTREPGEVLALVEQHRPGLLVADAAGAGIEVVREARRRIPQLRTIALGAPAEAAQVSAVLAAGAVAFVVKGEQFDGLLAGAREEHAAPPVLLGPAPDEDRPTVAA